jgi:hypothetical protein
VCAAIEKLFQVERRICGGVFKTEGDLGVAEAEFSGETVGGGTAVAKSFLDRAAKRETDAIEIARDTGFVFGQLLADFGESLLLGIVKAKALLITGIESGDGGLQGTDK